jgi:hypothetical protein
MRTSVSMTMAKGPSKSGPKAQIEVAEAPWQMAA